MRNGKSQAYKLYGVVLAVILLLSFVFLAVFLTGPPTGNNSGQDEMAVEQNEEGPKNEEEDYVGIYNDRIAIFQGVRPEGKLIEITDYEVKEVYRRDLEKGIPFEDEEEKIRILESYTS